MLHKFFATNDAVPALLVASKSKYNRKKKHTFWSEVVRYLDSSTRTADQALGHWIENEAPTSVEHLRLQTGYFSINGLSAFSDVIKELVDADLPISAVIGSNEKDTTKSDVEGLIDLVGCPRANARVCIVSYSGGLFHPKVAHLTRTDGSQLAYVGSANLTPAGVGAGNIEAGLLLDTNDGDPINILSEIAATIDRWYDPSLPEVSVLQTRADVQQCVNNGILGLTKPARPSTASSGGATSGTSKPALSPIKKYPPIVSTTPAAAASSSGTPSSPAPTGGTSTTTSATSTSSSSSTPTSSTPAPSAPTPATSGQDVLIAEIGGGSRWKQANFPIAIMQSFFGVNPVANDHIQLHEVEAGGAVSNVADTLVVNVKSQNYRMELSTVSGIPYPTTGRPIGIFRKIAAKEFRYRIFMPTDTAHPTLDTYLAANYSGQAHHLKRIVIDRAQLNALWPACPV